MLGRTTTLTQQSIASADSVLGSEHLIRRLSRSIVDRKFNEAIFDELKGAGVTDQGAKIIAGRTESLDDIFLNLNCTTSPTFYGHIFPHISKLAELLFSQETKDKGIAVVYDYDVDGATSAAQLKHFLDRFGIKATWMTPRRERDGYGVKQWMVDNASQKGHHAFITLDCGTADNACLLDAQSRGMQTVVIDHHVPTHDPAPGLIYNPFVNSIELLKVRSASGLVHDILTHILAERGELDSRYYTNSLALATLGTVADVMKLQGVNRALVSQGLDAIRDSTLPGIQALRAVSKKRGSVDTQEIGFNLGPRINAPGRMDETDGAALPFSLLTGYDEEFAYYLASTLEGWNIRRQDRELVDVENAYYQVLDEQFESSGICIYSPDFHLGVVGLVASRISQKFDVPTLVIGRDKIHGVLKGSLRVPDGYDGLELLEKSKAALIQYGGHVKAGGVSLEEENLPLLTTLFAKASYDQSQHLPAERSTDTVFYDDEVTLKSIGIKLAKELATFGPYGEGFSSPVLLVKGVILNEPRIINDRSLEVTATQGDVNMPLRLKGIKEHSALRYGIPCDIAVTLQYSEVDSRAHFLASIEAVDYSLR